MKYCGVIGFAKIVEASRGVDVEEITERQYTGDLLRNVRRWTSSDQVNDDLRIDNQVSVVADRFMTENIGAMRYVTHLGMQWSIASADIQPPRVILTLGGLYNGGVKTTETPETVGGDYGA